MTKDNYRKDAGDDYGSINWYGEKYDVYVYRAMRDSRSEKEFWEMRAVSRDNLTKALIKRKFKEKERAIKFAENWMNKH